MKMSTLMSIAIIVGLIALFIVSPQLRSLLGLSNSETISIEVPGGSDNGTTTGGNSTSDVRDAGNASQDSTVQETAEQEYELVTLLSKDAIPSIDNPQFVTGEEADAQYSPDELVLGVEIDGEARAYSIPFLSGHEIVNDEIGGQPFAVTW